MYRMKQMAAMLRKKELDIKYHFYYSQMESLTYIPKIIRLNNILCNVVAISILLNIVLQTLYTSNTYQRNAYLYLLDQNKLKKRKEISISNQLT